MSSAAAGSAEEGPGTTGGGASKTASIAGMLRSPSVAGGGWLNRSGKETSSG